MYWAETKSSGNNRGSYLAEIIEIKKVIYREISINRSKGEYRLNLIYDSLVKR